MVCVCVCACACAERKRESGELCVCVCFNNDFFRSCQTQKIVSSLCSANEVEHFENMLLTSSARAHFVFQKGEVLLPTDWLAQLSLIMLHQFLQISVYQLEKNCTSRWCTRWKFCTPKWNFMHNLHRDVRHREHWTLTLKAAKQSFCMTIQLMMMPYQTKFGFSGSEGIIWTNNDILNLHFDLDHSNPIFSQDTPAYMSLN